MVTLPTLQIYLHIKAQLDLTRNLLRLAWLDLARQSDKNMSRYEILVNNKKCAEKVIQTMHLTSHSQSVKSLKAHILLCPGYVVVYIEQEPGY